MTLNEINDSGVLKKRMGLMKHIIGSAAKYAMLEVLSQLKSQSKVKRNSKSLIMFKKLVTIIFPRQLIS